MTESQETCRLPQAIQTPTSSMAAITSVAAAVETPSTSGAHPVIYSEEACNNLCQIPTHITTSVNPFVTSSKSPPRRNSFKNNNIRRWEKTSNSSINKTVITNYNGLPFVLLSYNILAQLLLEDHGYLYRNIPRDYLGWEYRFGLIRQEISAMNPDIICLQEVQVSHLEFLMSHFEKLGYKSIYKQRTGIRVDGCAIFYKSDLFTLVDHQSVEFLQPDTSILNRDNIGLMAKFTAKSLPNTQLVVCTTHLLYNPKRVDVRLAQMKVFLAEIDRFAFYYNSTLQKAQHLPIILTGDLNSTPESPVTSLINNGFYNLSGSYVPLENISVTDTCQHLGVYVQRKKAEDSFDADLSLLRHSEKAEKDVEFYNSKFIRHPDPREYGHLFNNSYVKHHLDFHSVYNHVKDTGETEATTKHDEWLTIDYIYYSSNNATGELHLQERLRLPTARECSRMGYIPNAQYGSDHLSLAAKFILYDNNESARSSSIDPSTNADP